MFEGWFNCRLAWFVLGFGFSALCTYGISCYVGDVKILCVSQEEIIALEQERIKDFELKDRYLFMNQVNKAIDLARVLPRKYVNKNTRVIYTMGKASGIGVKSISHEIHAEIIKTLGKEHK